MRAAIDCLKRVNTTTTDGSSPTVAALADGRFVVAWEFDGIHAQVFNADGTTSGALVHATDSGEKPTITGRTRRGSVCG